MKPRRRLDVTYVPKQERIIFQGEHFLNSRYLWNWNDCFTFPVQPKAPDLRRAAEHVADIKGISRGNDLTDDGFTGWHDFNRIF